MKNRLILLCFLLMFSLTSFAQKKCNIKIEITNYSKGQLFLNQPIAANETGVFEQQITLEKPKIINLSYVADNRLIASQKLYIAPDDKITITFSESKSENNVVVKGGNRAVNEYFTQQGEFMSGDFNAISLLEQNAYIEFVDQLDKNMPKLLAKIRKYDDIYKKEQINYELYRYNVITFYYDTQKRKGSKIEPKIEEFYQAVQSIDFNDSKYIGGLSYNDCISKYLDKIYKFDGKEDYFVSEYNFIENHFSNVEVLKQVLLSKIMMAFSTVEPQLIKEKIEDYCSKYGDENRDKMYEKLNSKKRYYIGDAIPELTYSDLKGNPVKLDKYKGKYIMLYFWTTWCGPCKREAPYWEELIKKHANDNIVFVTISIDNKLQTLVDYLAKNPKGGELLHCDCSTDPYLIYNVFGIGGVPYFAIIAPDGKFVRVAAPRPSQQALSDILNKILK